MCVLWYNILFTCLEYDSLFQVTDCYVLFALGSTRNGRFKSHDSPPDLVHFHSLYCWFVLLARYFFIIYILWTLIDLIKENFFTPPRPRSRWYPTETIMDADYANELALLVNTPAQAESQLHSLEQAAEGIGLYMNANKTVLNKKEPSPFKVAGV